MYLKSIEIQGFKSFANKTVFQFHNGITGIVGPNGSGKSNVADAVRWVLGEQRVKQLRGGSMQDVIFAGTQNRKPLGYAYVAITLNNEDHSLPISYDEVTIARRLYRSGESEYLLNGTQCRLKDVNELFYDTGIGKEGYSIIGQGQIDKILSGKPEERRELFDEAAGIVKFKRRKLEASKKLESEQASLTRVNDILSELERQIGPLERQSEKAKTYLQFKEDLKAYDVNLFLSEYQENHTQMESLEQKLDDAQSELDQVRQDTEKVKEQYEQTEQEIEGLEQEQNHLNERKTRCALEIRQLEGTIRLLEEQIRSGNQSQAASGERLKAIVTELEEKKNAASETEKEIRDLSEKLTACEAAGIKVRDSHQEITEEISGLEKKADILQQKVIELLSQRSNLKAEQQRIETMTEQVRIRKSALGSELLKLRSEQSGRAHQLEAIDIQLSQVLGVINKLGQESSRKDEQLSQCQDLLSDSSQKMETGQAEYHRESSRLDTLRAIAERYDGYGSSIRRVMEQKKSEKGLLGVVADLIRTEKEYEIAIETALGGSIQNVVTEDEDTAKRMIAYLKKNQYGRATFLPLTAMKHTSDFRQKEALDEEGVIGLASTLVKNEKKYNDLVKNLLGRTIVVDQIDHAVSLARKFRYTLRIVTLEGELLSAGGSMTGGAFKSSTNLLGRRREIEELTRSVTQRKKELEDLRDSIDSIRSRRNGLRDDIRDISEKLQEQYLKQNTLTMQKKELEDRTDTASAEENRYQDETVKIREQIMQLSRESISLNSRMEASEKEESALGTRLSSVQSELDQKREKEQALLEEVQKLHLEFASQEQKRAFLEQELDRLQNEQTSLSAEQKNLSEAMQTANEGTQEKEQRILRTRESISLEMAKEKEAARMLEESLSRKEKLSAKQKTFFEERENLSERASLLDREVYRLRSQIEKLEEHAESRTSYMWEEYGLTYSSALPLKREDLGSKNVWRKQMADLKRKIRDLGNVNVNAIEEYREVSERFTFLSTQRADIQKAEAALLKIIEQLDTGMRRQFRDQFERIAQEFDNTFKQLFGGGTGTLELMEDEDILECGIRIIAQPPGKKLQNMMQLSGGEKALTAIALLFAIQNLKPSPFCLLDEIEAALDENNVERYAGYLHKLTQNTQFIIITHRRGTMAAADRLYGVTMQEKGVSALVSVNLIESELDA